MEETKRRKTESIVFAAGLIAVSTFLVYCGGIKRLSEIAAITAPVFGAALSIFAANSFWVRLSSLVLLWIPQVILLKTGDYTVLFFPILSLVFAASNLTRDHFNKTQAMFALLLSAFVSFTCFIYNASQYSLRRYFAGRWNKMMLLLILFLLFLDYLRTEKQKSNRNTPATEKTVFRFARILFTIAIADIILSIETLYQYLWHCTTTPHICCMVWLLFMTAIIRYHLPQADRVLKDLKLE